MPELERLRLSLDLKDRTSHLLEDEPWAPTKQPGTVRLAAGTVPEVEWQASTAVVPVQFQQQGATDSLIPTRSSGDTDAPMPTSMLSLPTASAATLSRHAILPSWSTAESPQAGQPSSISVPAQGSELRQPLYPSVVAELASELGQTDDALPSAPSLAADPWAGSALQLGPQEVAVSTVAPPVRPPEPGDTCCSGPIPSTQVVPAPDAVKSENRGVAQYTRRQSMRDVHVSVGLMNEFLQYVYGREISHSKGNN